MTSNQKKILAGSLNSRYQKFCKNGNWSRVAFKIITRSLNSPGSYSLMRDWSKELLTIMIEQQYLPYNLSPYPLKKEILQNCLSLITDLFFDFLENNSLEFENINKLAAASKEAYFAVGKELVQQRNVIGLIFMLQKYLDRYKEITFENFLEEFSEFFAEINEDPDEMLAFTVMKNLLPGVREILEQNALIDLKRHF